MSSSDSSHQAVAAPEAPAFYDPGNLRAERSIGFLMKRGLSSIAQQVDRRLAEHDLTHAQWMPLWRLAQSGPQAMATLARDLHQDPAAITRVLDRMEAKGQVQRVRSLTDRRVVQVSLTDAGRRLAELVPPVLADELNAHLAGFTHAEWNTLIQLLQRVVANGDARREGCSCAAPQGPVDPS